MKFLLIIWLYQSTGFNNSLIGHIATQKAEMVSEQVCKVALKKAMDRGNRDVVVDGVCVPLE